MMRSHLRDLPELELPAGVIARAGTPADAVAVGRVIGLAFDDPSWTDEKVLGELLANADVDETIVLEENGVIIATASAKTLTDRPHVGYVHYVATDPGQARRRLGHRATLAVLHTFVRLGKTEAILDTDDFRRPAIRVYRDLGFVPDMSKEGHPELWATVDAEMESRP